MGVPQQPDKCYTLIKNGTVANGLIGFTSNFSDDGVANKIQGGEVKKLRAAGPNSSTAWQRTVLICTTTRMTTELIAKVVLSNTSPQAVPQVVVDPSSLWYAFAPGNGTFVIGEQSVTISGDTEISATGATNGLTGVNCSVEAN